MPEAELTSCLLGPPPALRKGLTFFVHGLGFVLLHRFDHTVQGLTKGTRRGHQRLYACAEDGV